MMGWTPTLHGYAGNAFWYTLRLFEFSNSIALDSIVSMSDILIFTNMYTAGLHYIDILIQEDV